MKWGLNWGLRTRLVLAFGLLCVVTAVAVAGGSYVQARRVILQQAQDSAVANFTGEVRTMYPLHTLTPSQADLDELAGRLSDRDYAAVALYGGQHSVGGIDPSIIPAQLREVVGNGRVAWQRVTGPGGVPFLVIGTRLDVSGRGPSGIEVYAARDMLTEEYSIDQLAVIAWLAGGGALVFAVLLALLAARGVLRPVRELGTAAHRLGAGDLSTRLTVRGSDELARVAGTFNSTAATLEHHVAELRRMEADARRFVADVSHELRTPLAAMAAVTDVLDAEAAQLSGNAATAAALVSTETRNLTQLVNDLIEVSRFDSGAAALVLDRVDIGAAITATLRARGWPSDVTTDLADDVHAVVDPRRVDVVIANLVGNALRHGAPPVTVRLAASSAEVTVEVRDHGAGLSDAVLPHVFDRFYKADQARTRSASTGSGLGLAIARENARLHGGELTAGNHPDGGAVFTLRLPRRDA